MKEAVHNDTRQKLVNDLINGSRTIKSYGWENHYIERISDARSKQLVHTFQANMIQSLGFAVFSNGGLIACIAIFGSQWARGEELDMGESMSLLAMVFYIFLSVNSMTYMAMTSL
jgi:ABC-type multidrug transport system fused ATPase/permease subunit